VLEAGVPDGAYTAVTGDDKKVASAIKNVNKAEAKEAALFRHNVKDDIERIASAFAAIAELPETMPDEVHAKEQCYVELRRSGDWERAKTACDFWTAAFFAPLTQDSKAAVPTTRYVWDAIAGRLPQGRVADFATGLAGEELPHWPLEFPEVFAQGGFDVMLGNPPWSVLQLNEQQFFLSRDPAIARAVGAARKRLIAALYLTNPKLNREYEIAKTCLEKVALFVRLRTSTLFKIKGKLNTYLAFAALFISGKNERGRSGALLPTNIIADTTNASFVKKVLSRKLLVHAFNFYEIRKFFPGTDSRGPFGLFTFAASDKTPLYVFRAQTIDEIKNPVRQLVIDETDVSLMNPLDGCIPGFMTASDLALTRKLGDVPIIVEIEEAALLASSL
jgi:hypothetical protein